jgi:hypothetical protein
MAERECQVRLFPKRKPTQLERQLAEADLTDAMGRAQAARIEETPPAAAGCVLVRTPQGRIAHLRHPERGVLCGRPGAHVDADPRLPLCRTCGAAADRLDEAGDGRAAS